MLMLHSQEEWWISAVAELDRLHVRPAAGGTGETPRSRCQPVATG